MSIAERRPASHRDQPRRGRRRWPWIVLAVLLVLLVVAVVCGFLLYSQAKSVRAELNAAKVNLSTIKDGVKKGDTASMKQAGDEARGHADKANNIVQGPLWGIASNVPFVGKNVAAVKHATVATDILMKDALPPAIQVLSTLKPSSLKVAGGGVNLEPFKKANASLPTIDAAFTKAHAEVADVHTNELDSTVAGSVSKIVDSINSAAPALTTLRENLPTFLDMAGDKGARTYLVDFQQNAEIRATGGNSSNFSLMKVDHGRMQLVDTPDGLGTTKQDYYNLPAQTASLYESDTNQATQNFSRTPNFPTTAKMFQGMFDKTTGTQLDGVLSVDPVVLAKILEVTGGVTLKDGTQLTGGNTAEFLYKGVYQKFPHTAPPNGYFAGIASAVFSKFAAGGWDPIAMYNALQGAVKDQRVYLWMKNPKEEQAVTEKIGAGGQLASTNEKATQVGIFLNNAEYSKLQAYLKTKVEVSCDSKARTVTEKLTMTSSAPPEDQLVRYQISADRDEHLGLPRNTMLLDAVAFATPGGKLTMEPGTSDFKDLLRKGYLVTFDRTGVEEGRQGKSVSLAVRAGQTRTVSYTTTLPDGKLGPLQVRVTPTVTDTPVSVDSSCSFLPSK